MSSFNDGQPFMSFSRGNDMFNAMGPGVGPGLKDLTQPATAFISDESLWCSEVGNPTPLKATNVLLGLLRAQQNCCCVASGQVNYAENWVLDGVLQA